MLSVGGSGARSRSKSPGRRDERDRSRSRDIRAPSPARRVAPPAAPAQPPPRSRKYYDDEEEDDLVSDSDDGDRHHDYSRAVQKARPHEYDRRRGYGNDEEEEEDEEEEDPRYASKYADPRQYNQSRPKDSSSSRSYGRDSSSGAKEYAMPGQFDDDDDRGSGRTQQAQYPTSSNGHSRTSSTSNTTRNGYASLPQYQYANVNAGDLKHTGRTGPVYARNPEERAPSYARNPTAQVTVESGRQRKDDRYDDRSDKYRSEGDRYRSEPDRYKSDRQREYERQEERKKELARMEKERDELARQDARKKELTRLAKEREELEMIEAKKRELDHLRRAQEEEAELRQKKPKSVTIRDARDYADDSRHGKRADKYDDRRDRKDDRRRRYDDEDDSDDSDEDDRYRDRHDGRRDDRKSKASSRYDDEKYDKYERREARSRHDSDAARSKAQVVEIQPGGRGALAAPPSPGLNPGVHRLSISNHTPGALTLAAPGGLGPPGRQRSGSFAAPPSPLLESYKGTYQTISPMPSPMALAHHADDSDLSDLDIGMTGKPRHRRDLIDGFDDESELSRAERRPKSILKRHQEIGEPYDPDRDATALATELKRSAPEPEILIKILPTLRNDSIAMLRTEYKKHAKIQGKGINIAKHIKMKLGSTNVGKAAYATALGRWESEAHWANFWYQSGSSRRELLIEALFGRSNAEIRAIKDSFSDKRYGDSLMRCMEAELKKDKFRMAVLKVLEAKRGDDGVDVDKKLVMKDVVDLHKAVSSKEGGESAMINIIVVRSDDHLRVLLREYENEYGKNFAREMITKSQNLVGETLAHVLNGVLNRPVRDALLLHQAIAETSKDRAELIISRLVRFHWEPRHLERIKVEYRKRYGSTLEQDIHDGTKGDFSAFCVGLCTGAIR